MANQVRIIKIWKEDTYIGIMLNNASCVYFHKFGKTIYTEVPEGFRKNTFKEFKEDIIKQDWDIEKLKLNWINK
jgi:hypothetical protein